VPEHTNALCSIKFFIVIIIFIITCAGERINEGKREINIGNNCKEKKEGRQKIRNKAAENQDVIPPPPPTSSIPLHLSN
jgi:hypothetical protein